MPGRTFEDFEPGQVFELGSRAVTEEEIVDFARRFDPQPFHLDPEQARASVFGGLIASGWHTGSMWMRLYVDSLLGEMARQYRDVVGAIAQWRNRDTKHGQAEVQIFAELFGRNARTQLLVRGRHDAHVDVQELRAANTLEAPFLEHAKKLGLQRER